MSDTQPPATGETQRLEADPAALPIIDPVRIIDRLAELELIHRNAWAHIRASTAWREAIAAEAAIVELRALLGLEEKPDAQS